MRDKEFKKRDKRVHKMTRDGLVEQNRATGEQQRVSQRLQDVSFAREQEPEQWAGRYYQRAAAPSPQPEQEQRQQRPPDAYWQQTAERVAESEPPRVEGAKDIPLRPTPSAEPPATPPPRQAEHSRLQHDRPPTGSADRPGQSRQAYRFTPDAARMEQAPESAGQTAPEPPRVEGAQDIPLRPTPSTEPPAAPPPRQAERSRLQYDKPPEPERGQPAAQKRAAYRFTPDAARMKQAPENAGQTAPEPPNVERARDIPMRPTLSAEPPAAPPPRQTGRSRLQYEKAPEPEQGRPAAQKRAAYRFTPDAAGQRQRDAAQPEAPASTEQTSTANQPETRGRLRFEAAPATEPEPEQPTRKKQQQAARLTPEAAKPQAGRLQFERGELPPGQRAATPAPEMAPGPEAPKTAAEKKLAALERRAGKKESKLERAQQKIPQKRKLTLQKRYDSDTGKIRRRLQFEKQPLDRPPTHTGRYLAWQATGGALVRKIHGKIAEVEKENAGVEAAHQTELATERLAVLSMRAARRRIENAPFRRVARLERQVTKANTKYLYHKALQDHPELQRRFLARQLQKWKIKRQYAKAAREAKRGVKGAAGIVKGAASGVKRAVMAVVDIVVNRRAILAAIVMLVLLVFMLASFFSSCGAMLTGAFTAAVVPSYKADDIDIHDTELRWTELEKETKLDIQNAERDHPDFDEYRYFLNGAESSMDALVEAVKHDPFALISYLSAMYHDFKYSEIAGILETLYGEYISLEFEEEVEIRTREGNDGEEEEYEWYILNVKLTVKEFETVVRPPLDANDMGELYDAYNEAHGGHQWYGNPFGYNWLNNITSYYGERENPTGSGWQVHRGLDIAAPLGTPLYAIQDGTVVSASWHDLYGNTIIVRDSDGRETRFAHCNALLAATGQKVKKGEQIAAVGSTGNSTGPHLHVEIKVNGQYMNPLYLLEFTPKEENAA